LLGEKIALGTKTDDEAKASAEAKALEENQTAGDRLADEANIAPTPEPQSDIADASVATENETKASTQAEGLNRPIEGENLR